MAPDRPATAASAAAAGASPAARSARVRLLLGAGGAEGAVDVDAAACGAGAGLPELVEDAAARGAATVELPRFPGGAALLRSVLAHLSAAPPAREDGDADGTVEAPALANPPLAQETLGEYLEAGALLGSSRLVCDLANSRSCEGLTSLQALPLLELLVSFTGAPLQPHLRTEVAGVAIARLSDAMEEAFAAAIGKVCSRVDPRDFRLGPTLARGSAKASLEVLRAHKAKYDDPELDATVHSCVTMRSVASVAASGLQSVRGSAVGRRSAQRIEWTEQQFVFHVLLAQLESETRIAQATGTARPPRPPLDASRPGAEPDEAPEAADDGRSSSAGDGALEEDVAEEACDAAPDDALLRLAGLAAHLDTASTPPVLAALSVRALLLARRDERADAMFQAAFARSPTLRAMVVGREVPVSFLRGVVHCREASVTLRRILSTYESNGRAEVCDLVEDMFFAELLQEEHSHDVLVKHVLARHLILWMRSGGHPNGATQGARAFGAAGAGGGASGDVAGEEVRRLRRVGARLFAVCFVPHGGFLPGAAAGPTGATAAAGSDSEPCPWDSGALDLALLEVAPPTEDSLQLVRRVLLRILRLRRLEDDVHEVARIWPLGRWPLCHDAAVVREAFAFLSDSWRAAVSPPVVHGGGDFERRAVEEQLFKMFTDLEIWRLPTKELLTPWVPGQVLVCHVAAQCRALEDKQVALVEETRENLEEISRLHAVIARLLGRLEATDARSQQCMQRQADLNETLRRLR